MGVFSTVDKKMVKIGGGTGVRESFRVPLILLKRVVWRLVQGSSKPELGHGKVWEGLGRLGKIWREREESEEREERDGPPSGHLGLGDWRRGP
jgi:hypothetical protein